MKRLLKYLKQYRKECVIAPLFKMLEASFELIVPLVMANIIDKGIEGKDTSYIVRMVLLMVLLGVVGLICSITAQYFAAKASVGFTARLRRAVFSHVSRLSYTEFDNIGTSTMITRMTSDMNQLQNGVNLTLRLFLRSPFVVFGAMIMAFTIDAPSAVTFAVVIPALAVVVFGIMLICMPLYKKVQSRLDKVLLRTRQNLSGVRVIRAFNKEDEEREGFIKENEDLIKTSKFVGRISALMNPLTFVIINIAIVVLVHTGALRVGSGIITQGAVVALYNYMSQILIELIKLANLIITITKAGASANRIADLLDIKSSMDVAADFESFNDEEPAVEFDGVSLKYTGAKEEAIKELTFTLKRGDTLGIIGATGSGKSSLINLIPRFYDATEGEVRVMGANVKNCDLHELRSIIGIVPQKAVLFKGSLRDNMLWGDDSATDEDIWQALRMAQAEDFVKSKGEGLEFMIEQGGRNLSGGQKQRLTIARALLKKPAVLILDDSASALDYRTDLMLRKAISDIEYDPAVIIVSQRTSSLMHAREIIVMDDGEMAAKGTHEELMENCRLYKEIYDSQFSKEAVS